MEPWREDVKADPDAWHKACVSQMVHWDECWLNILKLSELAALQGPRFQRAVDEGCHAIEPDNIDCYANPACTKAMGLSSAQARPYQLAFNNWTTSYAHSLGLAVGMKNAVDLIADTNQWYDFAVNEQCQFYQECGAEHSGFVESGRLVAQVEYSGPGDKWCAGATKFGLMSKWCVGSQDNGLCGDGTDDDASTPWHDCFTPWSGPLPPIHWTSGPGLETSDA